MILWYYLFHKKYCNTTKKIGKVCFVPHFPPLSYCTLLSFPQWKIYTPRGGPVYASLAHRRLWTWQGSIWILTLKIFFFVNTKWGLMQEVLPLDQKWQSYRKQSYSDLIPLIINKNPRVDTFRFISVSKRLFRQHAASIYGFVH